METNCMRCGGTERILTTSDRNCSECGGVGSVPEYAQVRAYGDDGFQNQPGQVTCRACGGRGRIETQEWQRCPVCAQDFGPRVSGSSPSGGTSAEGIRRPSKAAVFVSAFVVLPLAIGVQWYFFVRWGWGLWSLVAIGSGLLAAGLFLVVFDAMVRAIVTLLLVMSVLVPISLGVLWWLNPDGFQAVVVSVVRAYEGWRAPAKVAPKEQVNRELLKK